jgi:hypothetical protein
MKYLLTILLFSLLACDKDDDNNKPPVEFPTVTNISISSEVVNGTARPKFSITLNVPDASAVSQLEVFANSNFPTSRSGRVINPTSTQYVVIDSAATYPPPSPVKYFAFFTMKDNSYVSYYSFEVK